MRCAPWDVMSTVPKMRAHEFESSSKPSVFGSAARLIKLIVALALVRWDVSSVGILRCNVIRHLPETLIVI